MASSTYHVLRQEPTPVEPQPVDKITWVYVAVGVVPVIFACCGIIHYIRTHRRKQLQADKPVDIEMQAGELQFAQDDWNDDDPKITKVTGNPNSVWNQLESVTTEQLGASAKRAGPWQPTPDVYGFGDSAANDHGPRFGDVTRTKAASDLVQPPASVANLVRFSGGECGVLRSVVDAPAAAEEAEPSPTRSSWTSCRPTSSVYSADDDEEAPIIPPLPAIDEEAYFSNMDDEINRIVNTRILTPSKKSEGRRSSEGPANPRSKSHDGSRSRKHRTKPEYGRSHLVQGGWERKKKDSDRRRHRRSQSASAGHRPAERDRPEPGARRSDREPEEHRGHGQGKPIKKDEKPPGWFDKMAEKIVTGVTK